jgi:hypothetical protein
LQPELPDAQVYRASKKTIARILISENRILDFRKDNSVSTDNSRARSGPDGFLALRPRAAWTEGGQKLRAAVFEKALRFALDEGRHGLRSDIAVRP